MNTPNRLPNPYRDETVVLNHQLTVLGPALDWAAVARQATPWVKGVRDNPPPFWAMESLLKEYPIGSAEGLALMRLAEALLRIPDAPTAIALTADQLGRADFEGASDSALARLSSAAISMSKHFLPDEQLAGGSKLMARLGAKTVVAAALRAVQLLGKQFVLGQTIEQAQKIADSNRRSSSGAGLTYSYDMLGEGARTEHDAQQYLSSYIHAIQALPHSQNPHKGDGISIKLSALHPRYEYSQQQRVMQELVPRVWQLCELAAKANINLTIDAEEVDRLELSLEIFDALLQKIAAHYPSWKGFGLAMQAYQTRALDLIETIAAMARQYGVSMMCRLVKGAYWDAEIKRAQEMGLAYYPVFTHKHHTDVSYLACAHALLRNNDIVYPQFATHNAATIAAIIQMATKFNHPNYELQRLHGMGEGVYREVTASNPELPVRVYAPVGAHRDLLAYLVRRLLENGANSSFVHQLADESIGMDQLLTSPLQVSQLSGQPAPAQLYGSQRRNSEGLDLADAKMRTVIEQALSSTTVPTVPVFDPQQSTQVLKSAQTGYRQWSARSVSDRANILRLAADQLQLQQGLFCALLIKEAYKTWTDAIAEVREAIDFLRYYANEAERIMAPIALPTGATNSLQALGLTGEKNTLNLKPRGVWLCISPWNFPLAIFIGQVAAALATGNSVIAKPAEQTPGIAAQAIALLRKAGVDHDALQLCNGAGETVGAALVALESIAGVVFTGSTQVAKIINRALAAKEGPITPLIAETGGINAMIVDSSALPEQVCDAVVQSSFRSAGQRCSALRVLCVHEAIADSVIAMIAGAAAQLKCGDSTELSTDVPRLIDQTAYDHIQLQIRALSARAKSIKINFLESNNHAMLVAPTLFEVGAIDQISEEIFGPVLQIVRFGGDPTKVIEQINELGFGLTMGIQTRVDTRANALAQAADVGNVYINRNMIGAVVGLQPFGGEGLSGTGPKAGGPHYLYRFCREQTITINTTAAGGNVQLLA